MVLVTGVSWDLSAPQGEPYDGVGDTHDEQGQEVNQDDDYDMVAAEIGCPAEYRNSIRGPVSCGQGQSPVQQTPTRYPVGNCSEGYGAHMVISLPN